MDITKGGVGLESSQMVRTHPAPNCTGKEDCLKHVVPAAPLDVWCEDAGIGRLLVKWSPAPQRPIVKYRIRYSPVPEDQSQSLNASLVQYTDASRREAEVGFLMENRIYIFQVKAFDAYNSSGGPYSEQFSCRSPTNHEGYPGPPLNVKVEALNSSFILIQWDPPGSGKETTVLTYSVEVSRRPPTGHREQKTLNGSDVQAVVGGLEAGHRYYVTVRAASEKGYGESSDAVVVVLKKLPVKIVVRVSYKEGIIAGVCIALICIILCVCLLYCKPRFVSWRTGQEMGSPHKVNNGHLPNGHLPRCPSPPETQELQTLLPANPECDAKGGVDGAQPRCSRLLRQGFIQSGALVETSRRSDLIPIEEDLVVAVAVSSEENGMEKKRGIEISSDLSHSPAQTASSLQSCNLDDRNSHHISTATSMPNLADSGIWFEERSTADSHRKGICFCGSKQGRSSNGFVSPLRPGTAY